jgi:hypothetical protein
MRATAPIIRGIISVLLCFSLICLKHLKRSLTQNTVHTMVVAH